MSEKVEIKDVKSKMLRTKLIKLANLKAQISVLSKEYTQLCGEILIDPKMIDETISVSIEDVGSFDVRRQTSTTSKYDESIQKEILRLKKNAEKEGKVSYDSTTFMVVKSVGE